MNDERLILYYYDELDARERREVEQALAGDDRLAQHFQRLVGPLEALHETGVAELPDGLTDRLRTIVRRQARIEAPEREPRRGWHGWSFALGSAVTAALVVGLGISWWFSNGIVLEREPTLAGVPPASETATSAWSTVAFQRGLQDHFRSSRVGLGGLGGLEVSERTALADRLLERNRNYSRLAMQNGEIDVARVLRSFEPMLERLADPVTAEEEAATLMSQLQFEMGVVLTKMARVTSDETHETEPETTI